MHWLQLKLNIRKVFGLIIVTIGLLIWFYPIRIVSIENKSIKMSSNGYEFDGKIFSGFLYHLSQDYQLLRLLSVKKGALHGFDLQWYPNGQRFIEKHYYEGKEVGVHKSWYEDGKVQFYKTFENGLPHGDFFEWHTNGQVSLFIRFDHGKEIAAKAWTFKGKPFYNYVWNENLKIGLQGDKFCAPRKNNK